MTRIQKERFASAKEYNDATKGYRISAQFLQDHGATPSLSIVHPLPRVDELDPG